MAVAAAAAIVVACKTPLDINTPRVITTPVDSSADYSDARALSMVMVDSSLIVSDVPRWLCDGGLPQNTFSRIDTVPKPPVQKLQARWKALLLPPPFKPDPLFRRIAFSLSHLRVGRGDSTIDPMGDDSIVVYRSRHKDSEDINDTLRPGHGIIARWSAGIDPQRRLVTDTLHIVAPSNDDPPDASDFRAILRFRY